MEWVFCRTFSDAPVEVVAFSPDGALLAVALSNGCVDVHKTSNRDLVGSIDTKASIRSLSFSQDGSFLAAGTNEGSVHFLGIRIGIDDRVALPGAEGKAVTKLRVLEGAPSAIAICDEEDVFVVNFGLLVGKPSTASLLMRLPRDTRPQHYTISSAGTILLGDELPRVPEEHEDFVAFSHDGSLVASAGSRSLQVSSFDGTIRRISLPEESITTAVAISDDGRFVARASAGERLMVWNIEDGTQVSAELYFPKRTSQVVFSPDGGWMAAVWQTNNVTLWQIRRPELAASASAAAAAASASPAERIAAVEARVAAVEARLTHELATPASFSDGGRA